MNFGISVAMVIVNIVQMYAHTKDKKDANILRKVMTMAEYIDKERAKKRLISDYAYAAARILDELPAADVVEVKHGQWKALPFVPAAGIPTAEAICSECGRDVVYQVVDDRYMFENYCPHCGAKMDKGGADNG